MRKIFFFFLWFVQWSYAQYTSVPDRHFEQVLIDLQLDDTLDGRVLTSRIDTVRVLDLSRKNIADLTGIQDFTALEDLDVTWNQLTRLEIHNLNHLTSVYAEYNQLTELSVTGCPQLSALSCHDNFINQI